MKMEAPSSIWLNFLFGFEASTIHFFFFPWSVNHVLKWAKIAPTPTTLEARPNFIYLETECPIKLAIFPMCNNASKMVHDKEP